MNRDRTSHDATGRDTNVSAIVSVPEGAQNWSRAQVRHWIDTGVVPSPPKRPVPRKLRIEVWHRDEGICRLCGEPADPLDWTVDHIMPESIGGPTVIHNLRVTHPRCNRSRPHPLRMTEQDLDDAAMDWTENELALETATALAELMTKLGLKP